MISLIADNSFSPSLQTQDSIVSEPLITVEAAAAKTGYNLQYLRRLLRSGKLQGVKIGQVWLIKINSLENYLSQNEDRRDRRCGPRTNWIQS
jgi:excisionase family DNA binding protein